VIHAATLLPLLLPAASVPERFEYRRLVMGTEARIVLYADDEPTARAAAAAAFERMDRVEDALSDWRVDSELAGLDAHAGRGPLPVSADLFDTLRIATEVARASDGAFDVTVGPLTVLWRAARAAPAEGRATDAAALEQALGLVGWQRLELDPEARTAALRDPGMRLDLGGIGKGFACDRALAILAERGIERALAQIGGEVAVGAPPPGASGWTVEPRCGELTGEPLRLAGAAVSTSGDVEQHVVVDGVRRSHVLDPRTGLGLVGRPCVTVVAPSGALADALASAAEVLGPRPGRELVARFPGTSAWFAEPGWEPLFDGRTLEGWTERGGRYDGDADWSVEDGCLVGRVGAGGRGGLLYTERELASCAVQLEVRIDAPFDSGLFLRMAPEGRGVQVTLDDCPGGEIAALFSDGFLLHRNEREPWREGEWNHLEVRCTGMGIRTEVWLNGRLVADHRVSDDAAAAPGFAPRGRIGLQVHGGRDDPPENAVRFRRVLVRDLDR